MARESNPATTRSAVIPATTAVGISVGCGVGQDFEAFGYPDDTLGNVPSMPTARLFKGHIQRFFDYTGTYRYYAAELSVPSPAGLSGGPIMKRDDPAALLAMAAGNHESELYVDYYEGEQRARAVTRYGLAVALGPLAGWIEEQMDDT